LNIITNLFKAAIGLFIFAISALLLWAIVASLFDGDDSTQTTQSIQTQNTEQAYTDFMVRHSGQVADTLTNISELMMNPTPEDENWVTKTVTSLITLEELAKEAIGFSPVPEKYSEMHNTYLKAMEEFEYVAQNLPTAIDNQDDALINELASRIMKANEQMSEATKMAKELIR